ncbi:MAG: phosphotransferase [Endozoicomonas sp.]|uniref:phosphotransferase n=1 Tax=Endozoicomonas sp. TaxID=1892382 RepID=UPI003D9B682A
MSKFEHSVIVKITTEKGLVYFKKSDVSEAFVASRIAKEKPDFSPDILGADIERGWLLTRSGGDRLIESGNSNHWFEAVRKLGIFHRQVPFSTFQSGLKTTSFYYNNLSDAFSCFLNNKEWLSYWDIEEVLYEDLVVLCPEVEKACCEILKLNLPDAVCHGDAHPMNVLFSDDSVKWFDWCEATLSNPMTDIGWFLVWLLPKRENLDIDVSKEFLSRVFENYCQGYGVEAKGSLLRHVMFYALAHRVIVYHQRFYQADLGFKSYFVTWFLKLMRRVSNYERQELFV